MNNPPVLLSPPGPRVHIDGESYLYFGGYNYLGLAARPEVIEAGCRAMRQFGVHAATSRAGFGTTPPLQEVERRAAEYFGTDDAYYFSSGYVAVQIMISALAEDADVLVVEASAHYSAHEAARLANLPVAMFNAGDLASVVSSFRRPLVVANAVGPATGELAPVREWLPVLSACGRATLLLDDAHGFGVLGAHGRGLLDELGLWERANGQGPAEDVQLAACGTLAKAFGGYGGIIPGTGAFVERARRATHHFDGATPPPAGTAAATAKGVQLASVEPCLRERLRENVTRLRAGLRTLGIGVPEGLAANVGMCIGTADHMRRIHDGLKARGLLVPYMETYSGLPPEGLLRLAVFADHTPAQLDQLLAELRPWV